MQQLKDLNKELLEEGGGEQETDSASFDRAGEEDAGEPEQVDTSGDAEQGQSVGAEKQKDNTTEPGVNVGGASQFTGSI